MFQNYFIIILKISIINFFILNFIVKVISRTKIKIYKNILFYFTNDLIISCFSLLVS